MQEQERRAIDDLFSEIRTARPHLARDAEAEALIRDHLEREPSAAYQLVGMVLRLRQYAPVRFLSDAGSASGRGVASETGPLGPGRFRGTVRTVLSGARPAVTEDAVSRVVTGDPAAPLFGADAGWGDTAAGTLFYDDDGSAVAPEVPFWFVEDDDLEIASEKPAPVIPGRR